MQTQAQHGNKKFKQTVPFYSPSPRLYGQTPAEIIKEARAAVMFPPAIGIKPVLTTRPFTPKEKERTLFGNFKKQNKHLYSLGFKNLQNQEAGSPLKLPSIENLTDKKTFPHFKRSHNLSLENLTEDYVAETLAEIGETGKEKLCLPTKSQSCPKEGRITKSSTFNELNKAKSLKKQNDLENFGNEKNENSNLKSLTLKKEFSQSDENSTKSTFYDFKCESSESSNEYYTYQNMIKGSGDYETVNADLKREDKTEIQTVPLKPKMGDLEILYPIDNNDATIEKNKEIYEESKNLNHTVPNLQIRALHELEENIKPEKIILENTTENEINEIFTEDKSATSNDDKREETVNSQDNFLLEKSTGTESKSNYLTMLKNKSKKQKIIIEDGNSNSLPLEILELYETANYYGVDIEETSTGQKKNKNFVSICNEDSNDYLKNLKDNYEEINEQMKKLQGSISNIEKSKISNINKNLANKQGSSEEVEFIMNNKKKYHVVGENKTQKEKIYEKYKENQNSDPEPDSISARHPTSNDGWDIFWKNSYFRNEETQKPNKEIELQRLINTIAGLYKIGAENKEICETFNQLYTFIKSNEINLNAKFKNNILKIVHLFVTNEDCMVLLSLARLLLYLKIDSSLTTACKMIFKVAGFDSNDPLFLNDSDILELFMEGIGRASPLDFAESCVYGYGALKFLTMNYNILSRILNMGALDLMTLHLKLINTAFIEKGSVGEQTHHALFQLTGALRNVAEGEGALPLFITTNCISVISKSLELFQKDEDVITNLSRTLSLLSTNESIIESLMAAPNFLNTLISLMNSYKENDQILIRLSFCLGNIVEYNDLARVQLSRNENGLIILLNILKFYIDKDLETSMNQNLTNNLSPEVIDDIIVKVIRIIANMSMNPIVGSNLSPTATEKKSLQLSQLLSVLLMRKDPGITLLATLGCLNNISYYCKTHSVLIDIAQGVERVLELPSEDCQAEAARVLGNLTRHKEIRDIIFNTGGINKLIKLLMSGKQEVIRYTCGALVNIMLDSQSRLEFVQAQGINKLIEVIKMFSDDWSLASLATRVIWNSCAEDVSSMIKHNDVEQLLNLLANSLEEENWKDGNSAWEEYATIATDLLEKINSHLDST